MTIKITVDTKDGGGLGLVSIKFEGEFVSESMSDINKFITMLIMEVDNFGHIDQRTEAMKGKWADAGDGRIVWTPNEKKGE